jgi:hypothetical protein
VIDRVDWPCRVETHYSEVNLGCGVRPFTGLSWVFEQVDRCIILEDDCLPDVSFFRFCDELLERYVDDERVVAVSGDNFFPGGRPGRGSYYGSIYPFMWGWATWRRVWSRVDFKLSAWPALRGTAWLPDRLADPRAAGYWSARFDFACDGRQRDIWDIAWVFACWRAGGMTLHPRVNLVQNIGFGEDSTHTNQGGHFLSIPAQGMHFPLKHPSHLRVEQAFDRRVFERVFMPRPPLWRRAMSRLKSGLRWSIGDRMCRWVWGGKSGPVAR